jgi:starch phosphorylase
MVLSNPRLSNLITEICGDNRWVRNLECLSALEPHAEDSAIQTRWRDVKTANKTDLSNWLGQETGVAPNPNSLFDIQAKRIHEYKRQHLNLLHILLLYEQIKNEGGTDVVPRTFIFGGKAAPGYFMAKLIIKLINAVGDVINNDPAVNGTLRVIFMPDFNVKRGQRLYPAADLSEQISLAGKEASGTGNMKFSMNGALTIGTLDGANVEIREQVGEENFFLFGMTAEQVQQRQAAGYDPYEIYSTDAQIKSLVDLIGSGLFSHGDATLFRPLVDNLIYNDPFMVLADFRAYVDCQRQVADAYREQERWTRMSILNVARIGKFSSDRAIQEYAERIWQVEPEPISL